MPCVCPANPSDFDAPLAWEQQKPEVQVAREGPQQRGNTAVGNCEQLSAAFTNINQLQAI
eukprot:6109341-Alexandrium_andersonii.AAC.1